MSTLLDVTADLAIDAVVRAATIERAPMSRGIARRRPIRRKNRLGEISWAIGEGAMIQATPFTCADSWRETCLCFAFSQGCWHPKQGRLDRTMVALLSHNAHALTPQSHRRAREG